MLKVGDVVYLKGDGPDKRNPLRSVTVVKIGRQYAHLSEREFKIDLSTNRLVSSSYDKLYLTKEDYERKVEKRIKWGLIKQEISGIYECPEHLTIENLNSILDILYGDT